MDRDTEAPGCLISTTGNAPNDEDLLKYKVMFETARDIIFFYMVDGSIIDVNGAAVKAYGYSREQLLSMNIIDLRAPFEKSSIKRQTEECCREPCLFETVHQRKDGSTFPVEITARCLFSVKKDMLAAIVRDITNRKQAEKALMKSKAILSRAQDIAHVGNLAWNVKTNQMQWSDEIFKIFGYKPQELQPTYDWFISRVLPEDMDLVTRSVRAALEEGQLFNIDYRIVMPDESIHYVNTVADRIKKDSAGNPEWIYGIIQDITGRKQIENQLRDAQEQAELYVDLMGHDINNMNMVALGFLEMAYNKLVSEGKLDSSDVLLLKKPIENLQNSSTLIDNVRKLQREKAGELRSKAIDLTEILSSVRDQYLHVQNRDITINLRAACHCAVMANELLRDIFTNLVGNAIKHSSGPLVINIDLTCPSEGSKHFCMVAVEDNGPGIPDAMKALIFDHSEGGKKRHIKGLGLYLVRTLVEDFHGRVWVEDRVPGDHTKGGRFVVMLPAIEKI